MTDAPIIGLKALAGNEPTHLNTLQTWLSPFVHEITLGWMCIWTITALVLLITLVREYRASRANEV